MTIRTAYLITLFFILIASSAIAQQYLVLEKAGTARNFKYKPGDDITIGMKNSGFVFSGTISAIGDTSFIMDTYTELKFNKIQYVYRARSLMKILPGFLMTAGIGYIALSGVNRTINHEYPILDESILITGAVLVGSSLAIRPLKTRKFDLTDKWRLKTIDFERLDL